MAFYGIGIRKEGIATDFAEELAFTAIVLIKINHRRAASGTADIFRDITLVMPADRFKLFAIPQAVVFQKVFPVPALRGGTDIADERRFIDAELLVFRGAGIVEGPLFKRDISADKRDKPAVLLIKVLNN